MDGITKTLNQKEEDFNIIVLLRYNGCGWYQVGKVIPIGGPNHTVNHCKPSFMPFRKCFVLALGVFVCSNPRGYKNVCPQNYGCYSNDRLRFLVRDGALDKSDAAWKVTA